MKKYYDVLNFIEKNYLNYAYEIDLENFKETLVKLDNILQNHEEIVKNDLIDTTIYLSDLFDIPCLLCQTITCEKDLLYSHSDRYLLSCVEYLIDEINDSIEEEKIELNTKLLL